MFEFTLQYSEAMKIAKKLAHSMSKEETRYYLNGFYVGQNGDNIVAVSTDGHRLTRINLSPDYDKGQQFGGMIFPSIVVKQIEKLDVERSKRDKAVVKFTVDGLSYKIEHGEQSIGGKMIDGTYPDFNRVIPDYSGYRNEYGDSAFNALYMAEISKAASYDPFHYKNNHGRGVRMLFQGNSPSVFLEDDRSVLYVLMPLRTSLGFHKHPPIEQSEAA